MFEGGSWDCWNLILLTDHPQIFPCTPLSREFQRLQKLSGKCKDFTAAFGNKYPTSLILDIKEREESMYKEKTISWFLTQSPDYYLLFMGGGWDCLHISNLKYGHVKSGRRLEEKHSFSWRRQTATSRLVCLDPAPVSLKHTRHKIFSTFLYGQFCQEQLFCLSLLAFHFISHS